LNITHVINCTYDNSCLPNFYENDLKYYNLDIRNWQKYNNGNLIEFINPIFQFIDEAIENGESVLVHCFLGAHRGGTIGCSCLMHYENLSASDAISKAKKIRPIINPTGNLKDFLYKFERDSKKSEFN